MTSDALLLIGRRTTHAQATFETHAARLEDRDFVDDVHVCTFESEPIRELRDQFEAISADRVFAVPMCVAHSYATLDDLPAALTHVSGDVRYCEPLGESPVVTEVLRSRATDAMPATEPTSLALVGFGSSSKPHHRQTAEYHAARIAEQSAYDEVETCYLLQNPTVECVRYNLRNERAVAVPFFFTRSEATDRRIPEALELDRGGIEYAEPLGEHPRITDAVRAAVEQQRVLADGDAATPTAATAQPRPVATDGDGRSTPPNN
ncbi:sirohydrochlorin chelatase [Halomicrobium sp. HM KBTZ05]|uniref:Sirohydrochlorin chelatase n=1 Tax=Halomicrobium mukohataei TaxID=57705 RepID=A0A847UGD4_9EURY|nr:CbiX/SirB N-terminal domain-containing protein [Halomicrobium mukohataei]NLV10148.1 sirohydrochlorin chelatase [Halomicrobium mukohataei]